MYCFLGDVFQSPSVDRIFRTIKQLARRNPHGVLIIIHNNQLDRLSFGLAAERANNIENVECRIIRVNDEIRSICEKQGLIGTLLIQKIAGAMSEQGFFLDEIYKFCVDRLKDMATLAISFAMPMTPYAKISSCARYMMRSSVEYGTGFHGEPGFMTTEMKTTAETAKMCIEQLFHEASEFKAYLDAEEDEVTLVVVLNNLGKFVFNLFQAL